MYNMVFLIYLFFAIFLPDPESLQYFIKNEEIFDVLFNAHESIGHGGRHRMIYQLQKKYKNVTQEMIAMFLKLCRTCQLKQNNPKKAWLLNLWFILI